MNEQGLRWGNLSVSDTEHYRYKVEPAPQPDSVFLHYEELHDDEWEGIIKLGPIPIWLLKEIEKAAQLTLDWAHQ